MYIICRVLRLLRELNSYYLIIDINANSRIANELSDLKQMWKKIVILIRVLGIAYFLGFSLRCICFRKLENI